ncbi:hypothetical protein [Paenibacillus lautus]|uniref:hypothetical protein n=1 Tax=Paenibacillus lautus TaxID=1401 RepID=UPI000BBE0233|nr:hypothetical protein [Paenibacillus lautus]PCL89228.1 hypothetical protein CPZ30_29460 [Paenibacillus lautus]
MKNYANILAEHKDCILYEAGRGPSTGQSTGWIGGNAPAYFDDKADAIQEGDLGYYFYLSLIHPFKPASMISIFIPNDYEKYVEHNQYPDCSIKVMEHPMTGESLSDHFAHPDLIKHLISHRETCSDLHSMDQSFLIKFGGSPRLVQDEAYYSAKLREEGFSFLFQVDEDGYPETLLREDSSYPFGFGALYIYANITPNDVQDPVAGFWQFS